MSLAWVIYFAGVAESVSKLTGFIAVMSFIFLIFGVCAAYPVTEEFKLKPRSVIKGLICWTIMTVFLSLLSVAIPDKTTVYLMAGTRVAEDIVKSPEVKEINGKILTIINQKLDSIIEPANKEK